MNAHSLSIDFESPLAGALFMAELGFAIFPLQPNSKTPYEVDTCGAKHRPLAGGINIATRDPEKIKRWQAIEPGINFGVSLTNNVVLDLDVKNDKGEEATTALMELGGPWPTLTVDTPSGGYHYYFQGPPSGAPKLCGVIDVKSRGGYVVCPGSRIDGVSYSIARNTTLAELPEDIRERIGNALEKDRSRNRTPLCEASALPAPCAHGPENDRLRIRRQDRRHCHIWIIKETMPHTPEMFPRVSQVSAGVGCALRSKLRVPS